MTTQQFCRKQGISLWTFYHWRRRLAVPEAAARGRGPQAKEAFVPLHVEPAAGGFAAAVEVALPGGVVVRFARGVEAQAVAAVVTALGGGRCLG